MHLSLRLRLAAISCVASWLVLQSSAISQVPATSAWRQWGGPHRNFVVDDPGLVEKWPETGPPVQWSRPLGPGHSAITVADGRLFTLYRAGNGRAKLGPWDAEETVVALDAKTGQTIWEHKYPSRRQDFSFGAGPHSTPLVVGNRVFTIGTNQELFAFDAATGKVLWSHDFIKELQLAGAAAASERQDRLWLQPDRLARHDHLQRRRTGAVGDGVPSERRRRRLEERPLPHVRIGADPDRRRRVSRRSCSSRGGTVTGLNPTDGRVLWSHPHDPGNDLNCTTPIFGPDNVLFLSSAYKAGSRAIKLRQEGAVTHADELWFTNRVRFMFLSAVRVGDYVYGTTGDFGPAFLTALDIKTGQAAWQHRGFGRASLLQAGEKTIVMDEDGDLALARLTPQGATILTQAKIFETTTWTAPTLAGTTLYARDREKIVALSLGAPGAPAAAPAPTVKPMVSTAARPGEPLPVPPPPPVDFAGTWRLDAAASRITDGAGLAGLIAAGAPPTIHVTQPVNGTLVVESAINEGQARLYRPGGKTRDARRAGRRHRDDIALGRRGVGGRGHDDRVERHDRQRQGVVFAQRRQEDAVDRRRRVQRRRARSGHRAQVPRRSPTWARARSGRRRARDRRPRSRAGARPRAQGPGCRALAAVLVLCLLPSAFARVQRAQMPAALQKAVDPIVDALWNAFDMPAAMGTSSS